MTAIYKTLIDEKAERTLFHSTKHGELSFGQIRSMADSIIQRIPNRIEPLYVYTHSAAAFCAGFLAASLLRREFVILPQAGSDYLASLDVSKEDLISDCVDGAVSVDWHSVDADVIISADCTQFDPKLVFFTSGSSGQPKTINKTASVIEAEAEIWAEWFADDVSSIAGNVSHQHIYGLIFRIALPILSGKISQDDMALSWEALMESVDDKTLIVSSPAHLTRLPDKEGISFSKPAYILSSGGPLPAEAAFETNQLFGVQPLEILGSTETGGVAWRQRKIADEPWTPVKGVKLSLGKEGELLVLSPFIPEADAVKMGDRVKIDDDGRFMLLGRVDRIVKVEGKRVSLPRVEDVFLTHDLVDDCAIFLTTHEKRERLSALMVLSQAGQLKLGELGPFKMLKAICREFGEILEPAELPKRVRFVADIPVNAQSKRVLSQMQEMFESQRMRDILSFETEVVSDFSAQFRFEISPNLPWFRGHFADNPVLPGLTQTHMAARLAEEVWGVAPASLNVSRMKFQKVLTPYAIVDLKLDYKPETRKITFAFTQEGKKVSSGTIG